MGDSLSFTVPGEPVPKARARGTGRGRKHYTPERTREAELLIAGYAIQDYRRLADLSGHYGLKVVAYCKDMRKDVDNLLKTVMDGVAGIVWCNDRQVFDAHCIKVRVTDNPRTEVYIWRME